MEKSSSDAQALEQERAFERVDRMRKDIVVRNEFDEERRAAMIRGIDGCQTWEDFVEALEQLASRTRQVQQNENKPRHGERPRAPSDLTQADAVLRALHYALVAGDDELLRELYNPAVTTLRKADGTDGRDAIAAQSGIAVRKLVDFGERVLTLVRTLPGEASDDEIERTIAGEGFWRDCPFPELRGVVPGHAIQSPRVRGWILEWRERDRLEPDHVGLARRLLRDLGVPDGAARKAIPSAR